MRRDISIGDRDLTVIGTAHVSRQSRDEVREVIEEVDPDLVCVELDEPRYRSLTEQQGWKDLDVTEAIRNGDGYLLFFNLLISIYQRQLGFEEGVNPGEEMLEAIRTAEEKGIETALVDQEIDVTLKRIREELSLWEKFKLLASFTVMEEEFEVEELKEENVLDGVVSMLGEQFPGLKKALLDERNAYMAEKILEKDFNSAVVVVGAAHVDGLVEELESGDGYVEPVTEKGFPWLKVLKYGMPVFILSMLAYSFVKISFYTGFQATTFWILSNGLLAMLGAIIARGHPLTWLVSFLAAPLTSLDPALGAGMVAAYAEGKFYPPSVGELESIAYVESYRALWSNQMGRILLVFVLVSIGSAAATFISAGYIASLISLV